MEQTKTTIGCEKILLNLVFNWDQTGLNYVPAAKWAME